MLILMKNYGIFTKIIVLQETRSKEAKRARKTAEKTKEGRRLSQHLNNCHDKK